MLMHACDCTRVMWTGGGGGEGGGGGCVRTPKRESAQEADRSVAAAGR